MEKKITVACFARILRVTLFINENKIDPREGKDLTHQLAGRNSGHLRTVSRIIQQNESTDFNCRCGSLAMMKRHLKKRVKVKNTHAGAQKLSIEGISVSQHLKKQFNFPARQLKREILG